MLRALLGPRIPKHTACPIPTCGAPAPSQATEGVIRQMKKHAKKGRAWAQHILGKCSEHGHGVMQSHYEAVRWHRKAAAQGHPVAIFSLAYFHLTGLGGCSKDLSAAENYLERAMAIDVSVKDVFERRMVDIGDIYRWEGNIDESKRILIPLHEAGNIYARLVLGKVYADAKNFVAAEEMFSSCAVKGHVLPAFLAAMICQKGKGLLAKGNVWRKFASRNLGVIPASPRKKHAEEELRRFWGRFRELRMHCSSCGISLGRSTRKLCRGCRTFCYCSTACQKLHWDDPDDSHKDECKAAQMLIESLKDVPACNSVRQLSLSSLLNVKKTNK